MVGRKLDEELAGDRVQGAQNVEALPARCGRDQEPDEAPDKAEQGAEDKGGGVDEEDLPLAAAGFFQTRQELCFLKSSCASTSAFAGTCPTLRQRNPSERRNRRT